MEYLKKTSFLLSGTLDAFGVKSKKSAAISLAKDLLLRLLPQAIKEDCTENTNIDFEVQVEKNFDMKTQIEKAIQSAELKQELNNEDLSIKSLNKEFCL